MQNKCNISFGNVVDDVDLFELLKTNYFGWFVQINNAYLFNTYPRNGRYLLRVSLNDLIPKEILMMEKLVKKMMKF